MLTKTRISIVDDDPGFCEALVGLLKSLGIAAVTFQSAADFLSSPNVSETPCLIADVHMPDMTGIELHHRLSELGYSIPTILITASPDDGVRARALGQGVVCYLSKRFDGEALLGCIRMALEQTGCEGDNP